uniref:28S ribosomal protein S27, mitochondrial n=1 Tax=Phallusia mammillata TaxID=59560 RepID=A0A6F9DM57_9ASCI|nr:28S ribosomal protein S27, mitochondrial [Phallusia mammillata]
MASVLQRFAVRLYNRKEIHPAFRLIGCRSFLSESYGQSSKVTDLMSPSHNQPELALQCLRIDQCHEKNYPVTSLMLDRVFRSIKNHQHVESMRYYLHKYRHSDNGYYLHDWIQYVFTDKCLKHSLDTLFEILKSKPQYGVFPHYTICNLVLDKLLKENNFEDAMQVVHEIFVLEHLEHKTTQTLVLKAITMYWEQNQQEGSKLPAFEDILTKRNIAGCIYCIGEYMSNPSLKILGSAILGSIEKEHGMDAVFQNPWGPLLWTEEYLQKACGLLQEINEPISQECVDILVKCIGENNEMSTHVLEIVEKCKEKNLVMDTGLNLKDISNKLLEDLKLFEETDQKNLDTEVSGWLQERGTMYQVEEELVEKKTKERLNLQKMEEIEIQAHDDAVSKLGYWFKSRKPDDVLFKEEKEKFIHLQKDYMDGCMSELELIEAFREKQNIEKDPIILMS